MTFSELSQTQGKEVAARMWAILSLESKSSLIQSLLDFMGEDAINQWATKIKESEHEFETR
jgi:hypothetical protein